MTQRNWGMLTYKESICLLTFLSTGCKVEAAKAAGYWGRNRMDLWNAAERCLQRPLVQEIMQIYLEQAEKEVPFIWKVKKLKKIVNSGAKDIQDNEEEVELKNTQAALDSLDMLNKMQGHYAPTKTENTEKGDDETKELLKDLVKQHEKPY